MVSTSGQGPLEKIIDFSARNWLVTVLLLAAAGLWGYRSLVNAPLDAIPDLSDVQVIVFTEWPGRSPDLVEDQITYPLTTALLAAPQVRFVRGQSFMGLSFVYAIFEDGTDMYWARSRVLEYLNSAAADLPADVRPALGPDATGVGWVYQYALTDRSGNNSLADLRSLQDFNLRYALESVPGVAEVASVGGFVKEYQINVDPNKLASFGIGLGRVADALRKSNRDAGGRVLEIAGHEHMVRGRGYVSSTADLERVVIGVGERGVPIRVADVASVSLGPALQRGQAELNGEGIAVGGIVVMRYGENALDVINRVKTRIDELRQTLPDGVDIVPVYDRSSLIEAAIGTLRSTLLQEMLVVSLVVGAFLLHARSALVVVVTLPLAVLLSFIPMYYQGLTANIMSLGGIAVAIGAMVDAAIVIIDNVHKRLEGLREDGESRLSAVIAAMQEVGPSIFFSLLIITVSFLPVFALQGTEGRLFTPLAFTKTYAMFFAALLSITLIPALVVLLLRGRMHAERSWLNLFLTSMYTPLINVAVRWRWLVIGGAVLALVSAIPAYRSLGNEFMPPLNEGSILYMPTAPPGMSIEEATRVLQTMDRELMKFPEVERVFGKVGRSTSATDPAPLSMVETNVMLKPESEWRDGMTWDKLIGEMDSALRVPGMSNMWWMPIQTRTEMLATGIRAPLGIKVFGPDLATIENTAVDIERALDSDPRTAPFTRSAFAERATGGYFLDFDVDRDAAARYGLNVDDVLAGHRNRRRRHAGGRNRGRPGALRHRAALRAGLPRQHRGSGTRPHHHVWRCADPHHPGGGHALSHRAPDAAQRRRATGELRVRRRQRADRHRRLRRGIARQVVADSVDLPAGYRLDWAGQFTYYERAKERLSILIPVTLARSSSCCTCTAGRSSKPWWS
jgi:copper/silver efflux system protein